MEESVLLTGEVRRVIARFAGPFLLANLLQALYGAVDLFVVGQFSTSGAVSAVSIGSQIMMTLTSVVLGISTGGMVLIGRRMGEEDGEGAARAVGTLCTVFALLALIFTPLMLAGVERMVVWMQTPAAAVEEARHYLFVCAAGLPFIIGYNVVAGIFRGLGDSRTPVRFVALACVINVVCDFALVGGLGLSARGAAVATVVAQAVSFAAALAFLLRRGLPFAFARRHFRPHGATARLIFLVGLPLALQDVLVNVSFLVIAAIINTFGVVASAAAGVVEKLLGFVFLIPSATGGSVASVVSHNLGAGQPLRARQALRWGVIYSLILTTVVVLALELVPGAFAGIFTADPEVVAAAAEYMRGYCTDCLLVCFVFNFNAYFSGCQKSFVSALYSLISTFCVRLPLSWLLSRQAGMTLFWLGFVPPLSTLFSVVFALCYYRHQLRREAAGPLR